MGIRLLQGIVQHAKQFLGLGSHTKHQVSGQSVPKGHFAVYVGEEEINKQRFVVPISILKQPVFQDLLSKAEQEFGFEYRMGNLVIPCAVDDFLTLTSGLNGY